MDGWMLLLLNCKKKEKKGQQSASSFRPISLTSIVSRVMESITKDEINEALCKKGVATKSILLK